ncbi:MAG: hypothetical protein E6H79_17880 [Betaproteobacteria bacterium]|nr:MAG: hypothetical protein E6H79_17880 [Betaproteobacteria bacterium]
MAAVRHVGIIGAGLAGLSAALAASLAGARVDVFEAAPLGNTPGAHIEVVPNLLRDLVTLEVGAACVRSGFPYQGFAVLDGDGRQHFEIPTPRLAGERHPAALGMVYGDLLGLLRDAALSHGAPLHHGVPVRVACDDGAIWAADGSQHRFDLAVIATGATLPPMAGRAARTMTIESLPQQWCHALLPRPAWLNSAAWVIGFNGSKAMLVPVDARRAGVAVLQASSKAATPAALRETLAGQGPLLMKLAAHWSDDTPALVRPVQSGVLHGAWHEQGVLRIGHSAHVLPPHFGQAAAQCVEDAVVLGGLLRERLDRDTLLGHFMSRRGERARRVHALVTQAARWDMRPEAHTDLRALAERLAPLVAQPA